MGVDESRSEEFNFQCSGFLPMLFLVSLFLGAPFFVERHILKFFLRGYHGYLLLFSSFFIVLVPLIDVSTLLDSRSTVMSS